MKKLIYTMSSIMLICFIITPVQAQIGSGEPVSRLEEFSSVDGRPMERGAGAKRLPQKALSQTFDTKISYDAGAFEDTSSCEIVAREEAKQNLVEKITDDIVDYYNIEVSVKYNLDPMVREETYGFLFSLVNFETTKEEWKNNQLNLNMGATINANDIIRQIIVLYNDKPLINHMIKNRKAANEAFGEIKNLKKENVAKGDKSKKKAQYKNAVSRLNATEYFEKGLFSGFSGENQSTIDAFSRVIELNPKYAQAYYYRGIYIYSFKKDSQSALLDLNKAIELEDSDASFFESRGICHNKSDNMDLAMKDFNRGIELDPLSASLLSGRAAVYEAMDQYQKALEDYTMAIEIDPENLRSHYRMGLIHKHQKNYQQCIEAFGKAIAINDQFADAFYERAMAYAYLKDDKNKEKVIDDFKAAAKLGHAASQDILKSINVTW